MIYYIRLVSRPWQIQCIYLNTNIQLKKERGETGKRNKKSKIEKVGS